jgi:hypothetical protein
MVLERASGELGGGKRKRRKDKVPNEKCTRERSGGRV